MTGFDKSGEKRLWRKDLYKDYYCKGGWLETNLYKKDFLSAYRALTKKGWAIIRWRHDVGVITGKNSKYVISLFTVHKSILPTSYFPIQKFAKVVYEFMEDN
tara:strand:+ start:9141 stop:9446 length:306 start_codon:yes stop_codon:yes gene_type:complete